MILVSDTIRDTLPYYLKAEVEQVVPESWPMTFGQYDLFPTDSTRLFFNFEEGTTLSMQLLPGGTMGVPLPFSPWIHSVFFLLFLFSFMLFAFIFRWEGTALKSNFKSVFSPGKPVSSVHKSQVTKTEAWGEFYLLLQTILIFSILIFSWLWSQGFSLFSTKTQVLGFIGIFVSLALLVYLKITGYRLIGTFFLQNEMKGWSTFYSRMMEILGIVFFLPVVFYVYLHEVRNIILIGLIVLFFISRLVIYIELLNIFVKNKISPFYFFVYLCGIEIAPYLLLYKGVLFAITIAGDNII
ncbi:DUF4271 domain-containing protein [Proteiniphilum acetatigenes]|uniref:DUF4271 domain-containing protein n=1 Tax=Proteiniphilum acetatigenes TaxID=294710 RepID=UPI0003792377|nr:DUF4271 domain-containing protein [Proteiniphilum acetatigenes]SFK29131.1 protein of unknown function [Porphyromonadaceae bacterium KH3CP3RA]